MAKAKSNVKMKAKSNMTKAKADRQRNAAKMHQITSSNYRRIECRICEPGHIVKAKVYKDHMKTEHNVSNRKKCIWCLNYDYDKIDYEHVLKCVVKSTQGYSQTLSACDNCNGERKDILNELRQQTDKINHLQIEIKSLSGIISTYH